MPTYRKTKREQQQQENQRVPRAHKADRGHLQLTALHEFNQIHEEHVSVPFTETIHVIGNLAKNGKKSDFTPHMSLAKHILQWVWLSYWKADVSSCSLCGPPFGLLSHKGYPLA